MDRRIKYTKRVLNESLIKFLEEKEITKITVTEICNMADVNRSTYYAHYDDPYDQLNKLKSELLGEMTDYIVKIDTGEIPRDENQYAVLKSVLDYADSKKNIFRILLGKSGDHKLQEEILSILGEKAFGEDLTEGRSEEEIKYLLMYAANGCFGIFYHWLMSEDVSTELAARIMAEYSKNLLNKR